MSLPSEAPPDFRSQLLVSHPQRGSSPLVQSLKARQTNFTLSVSTRKSPLPLYILSLSMCIVALLRAH